MEQNELVDLVIDTLETQGITYLLVGSFASGVYVSGAEIDRTDIARWAATLNLTEPWQAVLDRLAKS